MKRTVWCTVICAPLSAILITSQLLGAVDGTIAVDDPPAVKKPADEIRDEGKQATIAGQEFDIRIACDAGTKKCTPDTIYFSKPEVSFIEITNLHVGKPLTIRLTAGELAEDDKGEATIPVFIVRSFSAVPDRLVIALRKVGHRWKPSDSQPAQTENPIIDFGLFARAPALMVQLTDETGTPSTIPVNLRYQRWFVDMGGFLTFNTVVDQELVTHAVADGVVVDKKREKDTFTPTTGAVLNFHPGSYPVLGIQFGLATNNNRQPSYFLGAAYRLRELGARALLTAGAGIAAVPTLRFPDVKAGDTRRADDATLKGTTSYRFGPYLSFSFGFSFGDEAPPAAKAPAK